MLDLVYIDPPVWDAVCTFGQYQHETINGEPCITVHDASTCKAMLDDFAAHPGNDIFYDKQHEVVDELGTDAVDDAKLRAWAAGDGHAMAWANAVVMIVGGQVVRYEAHPGAPPKPPTAQEVLMQSDGTLRPDGVYCRRYAQTPRGADPISGMAAFRYTSPFFVPEKDGNRLLNLTVTNDPRMRDCALAFSRTAGRAVAMSRIEAARMSDAAHKENHMDPKDAAVMTAAGVGPDDSPEDKLHKMMAYARQMEEQRCAMEEERRKMEQARKQEAAPVAPVRQADQPFAGKESPEEEAGEHAMIKALTERIASLEAALKARSAEDESMRQSMKRMEEERRMEEARKFSRSALAMGRIYAGHKGDASKTQAWLESEHRKNPTAAEAILSPEGTYKNAIVDESVALQKMTRGGAGIGAPDPSLNVPTAPTPKHAAQARYDMAVAQVMTRVKADPRFGGTTAMDVQRRADEARRLVAEEHPELVTAMKEAQ